MYDFRKVLQNRATLLYIVVLYSSLPTVVSYPSNHNQNRMATWQTYKRGNVKKEEKNGDNIILLSALSFHLHPSFCLMMMLLLFDQTKLNEQKKAVLLLIFSFVIPSGIDKNWNWTTDNRETDRLGKES